MLFLFTAVLGFAAYALWEQSREYDSLPTVIEINAMGLKLTRPGLREYQWSREEIGKIYCDSPIPGLGLDFGPMNVMVITAGTRRVKILRSRSLAEIRWLISELENALERDWDGVQ